MKRLQIITNIAELLVALNLAGPGIATGASFQGLGHLDSAASYSSAAAISADGNTVVGSSLMGTGNTTSVHGFVWTRSGGMQRLCALDGYVGSHANDVSADGSVIVGSSSAGTREQACMWTAVGVSGLGQLTPANKDAISRAQAVSLDGTVIVGEYLEKGPLAFRWDNSTGMVSLGDLPGGLRQSSALDVSADGSIVVGYGISPGGLYGNLEAFRWTSDTGLVGLGDLAGGQTLSEALGISANGSVMVGVGTSSDDVYELEAFRWTAWQGMIGLGDLPGGLASSLAIAVSADGTVIVGHGTTETSQEAMVWDPVHGMRAVSALLARAGIEMSRWNLYEATDVSADGRVVVGNGINPQGNEEAWLAVLPDEEPPVILEAAASPFVLWPANNKMVTVKIGASVADDSGEATWRIIGAHSDEPLSDAGDIQIVGFNEVRLRAKRSGRAGDRTYTILLQAEDAAHNLSAIMPVQAAVPHDARAR